MLMHDLNYYSSDESVLNTSTFFRTEVQIVFPFDMKHPLGSFVKEFFLSSVDYYRHWENFFLSLVLKC